MKEPIEIITATRDDIVCVNTQTGEEIRGATIRKVKFFGLTVCRKISATLVMEVRLLSIPVLCFRHEGWALQVQ